MPNLFDMPALNPGDAGDVGVRWNQSFDAFRATGADNQFIGAEEDAEGNARPRFQDQAGTEVRIQWLLIRNNHDAFELNIVGPDVSVASALVYNIGVRDRANGTVWNFRFRDDTNQREPYRIGTTQAILDAISAVILTDGGIVDIIIYDSSVAAAQGGFVLSQLTYEGAVEFAALGRPRWGVPGAPGGSRPSIGLGIGIG